MLWAPWAGRFAFGLRFRSFWRVWDKLTRIKSAISNPPSILMSSYDEIRDRDLPHGVGEPCFVMPFSSDDARSKGRYIRPRRCRRECGSSDSGCDFSERHKSLSDVPSRDSYSSRLQSIAGKARDLARKGLNFGRLRSY